MPHTVTTPFAFSSGPRTSPLAIVGDFWGTQEELTGRPFMGSSGQELTNMLKEAGIERKECFLTNVFPVKPMGGKIDALCGSKAEVGGTGYTHPPISMGKYILPEYLPEVQRLETELAAVRPNLILALGNVACWALLQTTKITSIRGSVTTANGVKVLSTFHPSYVLRSWEARPIVLQDFMKAAREMAFPEVRRPQRTVLYNPTLEEIASYAQAEHHILSVDIETTRKQMASIGFASSRSHAIVIPFITDENLPRSHWESDEEEVCALRWVKHLLERPIPKLFQNGLYDLQYILPLGIRPASVHHDTMLLHHSMFPEMRKGLGFLGSIYTDEQSWKLLGGKTDSTKREE